MFMVNHENWVGPLQGRAELSGNELCHISGNCTRLFIRSTTTATTTMHSGKWVGNLVCKGEAENEMGGILGTEAEEGIALALGPVPHRNVAADEGRNKSYLQCWPDMAAAEKAKGNERMNE